MTQYKIKFKKDLKLAPLDEGDQDVKKGDVITCSWNTAKLHCQVRGDAALVVEAAPPEDKSKTKKTKASGSKAPEKE